MLAGLPIFQGQFADGHWYPPTCSLQKSECCSSQSVSLVSIPAPPVNSTPRYKRLPMKIKASSDSLVTVCRSLHSQQHWVDHIWGSWIKNVRWRLWQIFKRTLLVSWLRSITGRRLKQDVTHKWQVKVTVDNQESRKQCNHPLTDQLLSSDLITSEKNFCKMLNLF